MAVSIVLTYCNFEHALLGVFESLCTSHTITQLLKIVFLPLPIYYEVHWKQSNAICRLYFKSQKYQYKYIS